MYLFDRWGCVLSLLFGLRPTVHPCLHQRLVDTQGSVSSWDTAPFSWLQVCMRFCLCPDFPGGSDGKASVYNVGDLGLIPRSGRSPGEGNGNLLQYSCLENPVEREA